MKLLGTLFKKAVSLFRNTPPMSRLEREIWYTERALERYRAREREIREAFHNRGGGCCPYCYSGGELTALVDKIGRVETQLKRLYGRRAQRDNPKACR